MTNSVMYVRFLREMPGVIFLLGRTDVTVLIASLCIKGT